MLPTAHERLGPHDLSSASHTRLIDAIHIGELIFLLTIFSMN